VGEQAMKVLILAGLMTLSISSYADVRSFSTDGCTDFPNGTSAHPTLWKSCCKHHDLSYWAGGNTASFLATDLKLKACVAATGQRRIAELMYLGVRLGHLSPHGIRGMQWGNAWSETERRTTMLTHNDIDQLEFEILKPAYDSIFDLNERKAFIENLRQTN
jgi:hypothetical protein